MICRLSLSLLLLGWVLDPTAAQQAAVVLEGVLLVCWQASGGLHAGAQLVAVVVVVSVPPPTAPAPATATPADAAATVVVMAQVVASAVTAVQQPGCYYSSMAVLS